MRVCKEPVRSEDERLRRARLGLRTLTLFLISRFCSSRSIVTKTAELKLAAEGVQIPGAAENSVVVTEDRVLSSVEIDEEQYSRAVEEASTSSGKAAPAHGSKNPRRSWTPGGLDSVERCHRQGTVAALLNPPTPAARSSEPHVRQVVEMV